MDNKALNNYQDYKQWLKSKQAVGVQMNRNNEEIMKYKETNCKKFI